MQKPALVDTAAFERAIDEVAASTAKLLESLHARGEPRTREREREKAQDRWKARAARMRG
jgi:hypothetical protein